MDVWKNLVKKKVHRFARRLKIRNNSKKIRNNFTPWSKIGHG